MLVDDLREALPVLRAEAAGRRTDTCTITRGGAPGVFDPDTGTYAASDGTTVYSGGCRVSAAPSRGDANPNVASLAQILGRYVLRLPHDADEVLPGDTVTIDTSMDPLLVGRTMTVDEIVFGSQQIERKVLVQDPQIGD